jgi:hypothetical protein
MDDMLFPPLYHITWVFACLPNGFPSLRVICRCAMMHINEILRTWKNPERADQSAVGAIMVIDEIIRQWKKPARADKSAVGALNRPLRMAGLFRSCA